MDAKPPATIPYFLLEQIREMIIEGELAPGQPLREQDLEKRFGTSRSPIREALRLLELSGLVTHVQRRGFRVTAYSETEIRHAYELRAELQAYCILQLRECADLGPLIAELKMRNQGMAVALRAGSARDYLRSLRRFDEAMLNYTGNQPLIEVLGKLNQQSEPLHYALLKRNFGSARLTDFTEAIIAALARGDFAAAAGITRDFTLLDLSMVAQAYAETVYPGAAPNARQGAGHGPPRSRY
jgi:DNA-binding GntR family transcriptional regulator